VICQVMVLVSGKEAILRMTLDCSDVGTAQPEDIDDEWEVGTAVPTDFADEPATDPSGVITFT